MARSIARGMLTPARSKTSRPSAKGDGSSIVSASLRLSVDTHRLGVGWQSAFLNAIPIAKNASSRERSHRPQRSTTSCLTREIGTLCGMKRTGSLSVTVATRGRRPERTAVLGIGDNDGSESLAHDGLGSCGVFCRSSLWSFSRKVLGKR